MFNAYHHCYSLHNERYVINGFGPEVIKLFSCSTQLRVKFQLLIKYRQLKKLLSDVVFIMLINVKMPTFVGILTFMSRINFVLTWVEHEKVYNLRTLSCSTQLRVKFQLLKKYKKLLLTLSLSDVVFIMLINLKMPTFVGILVFMSRINFVLSWVEHEKSL